jgi:hypothetical protein
LLRATALPDNGRAKPPDEKINADLIGNALLSNTTACEASRLVLEAGARSADPLGETADGFRANDLMSLIDAGVLYEKIFFLPAALPDDLPQLELRNRLLAQGALALLPRRDDGVVGRALLAALSTAEGLATVALSAEDIGRPLAFSDFRPSLERELQLREGNDDAMRGPVVADGAASFDEAARELIGWMDYGASGAYEGSLASFRAMYYVFASEHHGLPYLPSVSVEGVARDFPNYFVAPVRQRLYERLASALRASEETVAREWNSGVIFVPPFSKLVLDRAATPAEIPTETLALRDEYSDLRTKMRELERERASAITLNARLKAVRQIERLGKEVTRPFDQPSEMRIEASLRYIPDTIELAGNPTNPVTWARMLLDKPAEALIGWYRRRPIAKLVRAAKASGEVEHYDRLLTKHFGESVSREALDYQRAHRGQA